MLSRTASVAAFSLAGFFLYLATTFVFVELPAPDQASRFLVVTGGVMILIAAFFLVLGLLFRRFRESGRLCGIVLLSVASVDAFMILCLACVAFSPGMDKIFLQADPRGLGHLFGHWGRGSAFILFLAAAGLFLIRRRPEGGPAEG